MARVLLRGGLRLHAKCLSQDGCHLTFGLAVDHEWLAFVVIWVPLQRIAWRFVQHSCAADLNDCAHLKQVWCFYGLHFSPQACRFLEGTRCCLFWTPVGRCALVCRLLKLAWLVAAAWPRGLTKYCRSGAFRCQDCFRTKRSNRALQAATSF